MGDNSEIVHLEEGFQPTEHVEAPIRSKGRPKEDFGLEPVDYVPPKGTPKEPGGTTGPKTTT